MVEVRGIPTMRLEAVRKRREDETRLWMVEDMLCW